MDCPLLREAIYKRRAFRRRQIIRLVWSGHRDFLRNRGAATAFPVGCLWAACPGTPGTGDIVPALSALALLAIVTGAHQAPGLSTRCIFLTLWPSEKTSKTREMCFFALFGV